MQWALSCMHATGEATPGFVRSGDFRTVLNRANVSLNQQQADEALQHALGAPLPPWMRRDSEGLLNAHQIATALASLVYSQPELARVFELYSDGEIMSKSRLLEFVRAEQLSSAHEADDDDAAVGERALDTAAGDVAQLRDVELRFERTLQLGGSELSTDIGLEQQQFVRQLLSPENDATAPVDQDLSAPLAHYWGACSHNSYIIGDQLTGLSSADAYRRQLIQGCRHVEIDCWDNENAPVVTHGHTFVTIEGFGAVAEAIADCAFVTSELPVILSLEMHCSPPQQRQLAELLMHHLGATLLSYEELCATENPILLSPLDLKRRVLVKGSVMRVVDALQQPQERRWGALLRVGAKLIPIRGSTAHDSSPSQANRGLNPSQAGLSEVEDGVSRCTRGTMETTRDTAETTRGTQERSTTEQVAAERQSLDNPRQFNKKEKKQKTTEALLASVLPVGFENTTAADLLVQIGCNGCLCSHLLSRHCTRADPHAAQGEHRQLREGRWQVAAADHIYRRGQAAQAGGPLQRRTERS